MLKHETYFIVLFTEPKKPSSPRRRTKLEKYRQERAAAMKDGTPRGLNVADDDYYILIEVEELKFQLEVSELCFTNSYMSCNHIDSFKILMF